MSFKETLYGCCNDMPSCLLGACVPGGAICLQASAVNRVRGRGCCIPYCIGLFVGPIGGAVNRERIREALGYHPDFWLDCQIWLRCGPLAGCQEYREVKKHFNKH